MFQDWNACKQDYKEGAVIFNDKVIVYIEVQIINNYDGTSIRESECKVGFELVKDRDQVLLGACGCSSKEQYWKIWCHGPCVKSRIFMDKGGNFF